MGEWRSANFSGENHPRWNDTSVVCENCDEEFHVRPSEVENTTFCSLECKYEYWKDSQRGSSNWNWKGGQSFYRMARTLEAPCQWEKWADKIRSDECYKCGYSPSDDERELEVHHIIPILDGGTSGEWNQMTLCRQCHNDVESYTKQMIGDPIIKRLSLSLTD